MTVEEIAKILRSMRFHFKGEKQLQGGIAQVLTDFAPGFTAEVRLTDAERIDFMVGDIGIEVKTADSAGGASVGSVTRQLFRYAKCPEIAALILVTTRSKHTVLPDEILGKPLHVVYLNGFF